MKLHKDVEDEKILKTCEDFIGTVTDIITVDGIVTNVRVVFGEDDNFSIWTEPDNIIRISE